MLDGRSVMPLEEYQKKRNFRTTSEPAGRTRRSSRAQIFVVQKHKASRLHYDFRLAIDGVLVSWAVPKGPALDPSAKRFATMTEDHPLEYADFEGIIPQGEYGAGTVMVWDRGEYELQEGMPAGEQLARGEIKVILHGKKLQGGFVMVHMGRATTRPREKSRWLLIKRKDEYAKRSWDPEAAAASRSVLTGRALEEIQSGHRARKPAA
jgi:bifunctional non-homologous end joining protein LigD